VDHKVQRFFPICDEGKIDYIAQSRDKSLMVIIESIPGKILLHLFDVLNLRKTLKYEILTDKAEKLVITIIFILIYILNIITKYFKYFIKDIIYSSFTDENYLLFIQTGKPDWTLFFYSFKQSKIISTLDTCPEEDGIVKEVIPCYYYEKSKCKKLSVMGGHYIKIYEYGKGLKDLYSCHKLSQREVNF